MNSILFALLLAIQQPPTELDLVLQRATDYVTKYEEELGNLIGTEDYVQKVAWLGSGTRYGMIQKREERRTSADFLIIQVGRIWSALRKVNQVDVEVEHVEFTTTPAHLVQHHQVGRQVGLQLRRIQSNCLVAHRHELRSSTCLG